MKATDQIREPHSVWLCLSETDNQFLSRIIATVCNLTGTANFQPHVTLLGDIDAPPVETLGLCREIFSGVPRISARVTDIGMVLPVLAVALGTLFFRAQMRSLSEEFLEAAKLDGAGPVRFFVDFILPPLVLVLMFQRWFFASLSETGHEL